MNLGEKIKYKRLQLGITQEDIAKKLNLNKSTIQRYETNKVKTIKLPIIEAIATYLNVNPSWLIGKSDNEYLTEKNTKNIFSFDNIFPIEMKKLPLLGDIACGVPLFANEDRESYVMVGTDINADFCLRCKGDSMIDARIYDGDIVFIKNMDMVENGDIAAVIVNDSATLKRVYYYPEQNKLILSPANPMHPPQSYEGEQLEQIKILGKAIAFQSDL